MKKIAAVLCSMSICCASFGAEGVSEPKKTTCTVSGVKDTTVLLDEKKAVSTSIESEKYIVYVGVRDEGMIGKGLVQIISKESSRPISTSYFEILSSVELNTNKSSGGLITVSCIRK